MINIASASRSGRIISAPTLYDGIIPHLQMQPRKVSIVALVYTLGTAYAIEDCGRSHNHSFVLLPKTSAVSDIEINADLSFLCTMRLSFPIWKRLTTKYITVLGDEE